MRTIPEHHVPLRLQSAHTLFSGRFKSSRSVFAWRSVVCLSCLDMREENGFGRVVLALLCLERSAFGLMLQHLFQWVTSRKGFRSKNPFVNISRSSKHLEPWDSKS